MRKGYEIIRTLLEVMGDYDDFIYAQITLLTATGVSAETFGCFFEFNEAPVVRLIFFSPEIIK